MPRCRGSRGETRDKGRLQASSPGKVRCWPRGGGESQPGPHLKRRSGDPVCCVLPTPVFRAGEEKSTSPQLCQCLPGLITATEVGPCSRARNFAAAQATQVASSGMVVQTFPFSDLVTSSACDLPTWSPRGAKGGVVQLPRWPGLRLLHRPIGKYQQRRASSEGSELHSQRCHRSAAFREAGPDPPLHRSGHEQCL